MSIKSDAFGRVTLTNEDAQKFANQVRYGRPKKAAFEAVRDGSKAVKDFANDGALKITISRKLENVG